MLQQNRFILPLIITTASTAFAGEVTTEGSDITIKLNGPVEFKTADGDYSAKLGGRIQWDYNYAELNGDTEEDEFDIRRARIYLSGKAHDWSYKLQFNIGDDNGGTHEDLYIQYNGWGKKAVVTVGNQKEPFGLEELHSSKDMSFLERSGVSDGYAPGRGEGVLFHGSQDAFTYAIGVFEDDSAGDDAAVTGRVTYSPYETDNSVVHLGAAYTDRAANVDAFGLEAAYVHGPYHLQAEYFSGDFDGTDADGFYLQAGWVITGEVRPYSGGIFKRITAEESSGAWEVVLRYDDGDGDWGDQELGDTDATGYGIGVNYYLNKLIRVGASYTWAEDNLSTDDGSEFRARLQIAL